MSEMDTQKIAKFLDLLRRVDGLNQKEIAESIGVSRSHVSEIYAGKKGLTLPMLFKLAELHHVQCWEIIYFAEIKFCDFNLSQIKTTVSRRFYALMCVFYQQEDYE